MPYSLPVKYINLRENSYLKKEIFFCFYDICIEQNVSHNTAQDDNVKKSSIIL